MAKRFKNLEAALKFLQDPNGSSQNEPPSGSVLANFRDFRDGRSDISYPRDSGSLPGQILRIGINAFGLPVDEGKTLVPFSNRANNAFASDTKTAANHQDDTDAAQRVGFIPAKAVVFRPSGATGAEQTSQITGIKYTPQGGDNYVLPYGKNADTQFETTVRAAIRTALNSTDLVSYTSEKL